MTQPSAKPSRNDKPIQPRLLIAEDNELIGRQLKTIVEAELNLRVDSVSNGDRALAALKENYYSVFVTDLQMPGLDGMKLIREIRKQEIPVSIIVITGHGSIDTAVQAMQAGVYDFFTKPVDVNRLRLVIARLLEERTLRDEVVYLREQLKTQEAYSQIISKSPQMNAILELVDHISQTTTTVLIEGETGTGKEVLARAIHKASAAHRSGPLVPVHCAALPENLLESELFGHEKGAFTGAIGQRKGRFEQAHKGTLFLDEVADIPMPMQVKLLRALQERRFERLGGSDSVEVDVRVIAATNRSLVRMVRKGVFREDLFYRLNVVRIEIPPLRDRPEDIPMLVDHFTRKFARNGEPRKEIAPEGMELLLKHSWPGNVRELENVVERACVTCSQQTIGLSYLSPEQLLQRSAGRSPFKIDLSRPLPEVLQQITGDVEKRYIRSALAKSRGHVGRCAKVCGMSRRSITAKMAEYGIRREEVQSAMQE